MSEIYIPIVSRRNVIFQVIRHFSVSRSSKIARLRCSVVLESNLKSTIRASGRNGEASS